MHRQIRVTGGHDLDSPHRYKPDVMYMVLYKPYPRYVRNSAGYQCIRLFVNKKAMRAIERMEELGQIQVLYSTPVRNGEIYDLDHREKIRNAIKEKNNGNGNKTEE